MNHPSDRIELEQVILGACLLENSYPIVAGILGHKNFLQTNLDLGLCHSHQEIFKVFEKLYPTQPIDLITVCKALPSEFRYYVNSLAARVCSAASLRFHAFALLEYNLRNSFIDLLQREFNSGTLSLTVMASLQEITDEALDTDNDIFQIIPVARIHLSNIQADERLIQVVKEFEIGIDNRIFRLKEQSAVDCLVRNLETISKIPHDTTTKMAVSHLIDILKSALATGKVDTSLANQIFQLKL